MPPQSNTKRTATTSKVTPRSSKKGSNTQSKSKKSVSPEVKQLKLYRSLHSQLSSISQSPSPSATSKVLKTVQALPASLLTFRTHLQFLISVDSYAAAWRLLQKEKRWSGEVGLEKAYCLTRIWKENEALEALKDVTSEPGDYGEDRDRGVQLLKAQLAYRVGDYDTAVSLYTSLIDDVDPSSGEHDDLASNLSASQSRLTFSNRLSDVVQLSREALRLPPPEVLESRPTLPPAKTRAPIMNQKKERKKVEANEQVDPERWIPLKMRSYYVPPVGVGKRRKEKEKEKLLTQGATEGSGGGKKKRGKR